jgi:uncharacterized protein YbaR (Trm112 family)
VEGGPLVCPKCARTYPLSERFCPDCDMPLVYAGGAEHRPASDAQERARKVKREYTGGELVRVAGGRNQAEAELIQNMLLEEGIPSILRRTRGFDVPDFLAAGPRDVLVAEAAYEPARRLLTDAELVGEPAPEDTPGTSSALRLFLFVVGGAAVALVIVWLLYLATG